MPWTWKSVDRRLIARALGYFAAYCAWTLVIRMIALTLITYYLVGNQPRYQDIADAYYGNGVLLSAISAGTFLALLAALHPLISAPRGELFTWQRFRTRYLPGFANGLFLGIGLTIAFCVAGAYRFLGWFFPADEAALALFNAALRILALLVLAYSEEFLFRQRILPMLRGSFPATIAAAITAILYWGLKASQYDLGWMHGITLFLIAYWLGIRASREGEFTRGAGFWAGILIALNPLFSLPIFGSDFQGLLLMKFEPDSDLPFELSRWVSGGHAGPLASVGLQLLILFQISRPYWSGRIRFPSRSTRP